MRRNETGGLGVPGDNTEFERSSSNFFVISLNAKFIASGEPVIVTILSGQDPSEMFILAPLSSRNLLTVSPFLPIMLPTSFPCMTSLIVRVTLGESPPPPCCCCFSLVVISARVQCIGGSGGGGCGGGVW